MRTEAKSKEVNMAIEWRLVESSNIAAIGYEVSDKALKLNYMSSSSRDLSMSTTMSQTILYKSSLTPTVSHTPLDVIGGVGIPSFSP